MIIAAPASGTGKTSITLGLLRALRQQGQQVSSAKLGPDYIDPAFHAAASGQTSHTLDPWSMPPARLQKQLSKLGANPLRLIESAMGLFDGAADGSATTASFAKTYGLPVVLVVDCSGAAGSIAALVHGFDRFDPDLRLSGLILNKVASPRHETLLRTALEPLGIPLLACLPRQSDLHLPSRHLGLVQAQETQALDAHLDRLAAWVSPRCDWTQLQALMAQPHRASSASSPCALLLPALGRHIAVIKDAAFSFTYPHILEDWQAASAQLHEVSALDNQAIPAECDAVFLPGGYPELFAPQLSGAQRFWASLQQAAQRGAWIYGECGGYMALGRALVDAQAQAWPMAGLLPHTTRFDKPQRHLGYRQMRLTQACVLGAQGQLYRGHEFHYSCELEKNAAQPLWQAQDARGIDLGLMGMMRGRVLGSYLHIVDLWPR